MSEKKDIGDTVTGHMIRLDDTRLVFLGNSPEHPGTWFLGFRNADGQDTKLTFSQEAMAALLNLATTPHTGPKVNFPHKRVWRFVEGASGSAGERETVR